MDGTLKVKIAVLGDAMLDLEISGSWNGVCPESSEVTMFKGIKPAILPGGAANVATICTERGATTDLYCNGPGNKDRFWISKLLEGVVKCNRIVWSGDGQLSLKIRGMNGNQVVSRIDADDLSIRGNNNCLESLWLNIDKYDGIIISDYCKGTLNKSNEELLRKIINRASVVVIDSKRIDYSYWQGATAIVPNVKEAALIYGTIDPFAIKELANVKCVFVTHSCDSVMSTVGELPVDKIDDAYVVGAGDAFCAGVTLSLSRGDDFETAGRHGIEIARQYVAKPRKSKL